MFKSIVEAVFYYADTQPNKLCIRDDYNQVSYLEYSIKIKKYAKCFLEAGLKKDDKVIVEACQTIDYLAIELALQSLGIIFVPVEHNCAHEKICSFIEKVGAEAVIICKDELYEVQRNYTYEQLKFLSMNETIDISLRMPEKNEISEILFSTGTTGKEKGIVITHGNNIALAENVVYGVKMERDNIEMIPSPLNHSHGLRRYYANMYNGSTVILLGSVMNIKRFIENIDLYGVNSMDLVPSALSVILRLTKDKLHEYKDRIRYIQFGAAPMMETEQNRIAELLPNTRLYNFYGSTESGCICIYDFNCNNKKKHCIGKPAYNANITIVDNEYQPIQSSVNNVGLLSSQGKMNMTGYWKDDEETKKVLRDGTVYSSDIAYFDEDGDIILLGRKGDVINVGGNKVSPEEIENVAKKMEGIEDCGVIPVEDQYKGHVPKIYVQMKKDFYFDSIEIRNFLANRLEPYKVPAFIEQIDTIPRSYNGKLLRKVLKNN